MFLPVHQEGNAVTHIEWIIKHVVVIISHHEPPQPDTRMLLCVPTAPLLSPSCCTAARTSSGRKSQENDRVDLWLTSLHSVSITMQFKYVRMTLKRQKKSRTQELNFINVFI